MAAEIDPPTSVLCPPHYWLIEKSSFRTQHWLCQRCGVVKDLEDGLQLGKRWPKSGTKTKAGTSPTG
jgi:hypothetical protein